MPWKIIGEGNANVVLSPSDAPDSLDGYVLRVGKTRAHLHGPAPLDELDEWLWAPILGPLPRDELSALKRQVAYVETVLGPLLGPSPALPSAGVICTLPLEATEALTRLGYLKEKLDQEIPVLLLHNALFIRRFNGNEIFHGNEIFRKDVPRSLCVEIKPKWVVMPSPNSDLPPSPGSDLKQRVPRFSLHQILKREERRARRGETKVGMEEDAMSLYNPLDLFSGDELRMDRALQDLIDFLSNNFRVFLDGQLRFGGRPDSELSQVYAATLFPDSMESLDRTMLSESLFGSIYTSHLPHLSIHVLKRLLVTALKETGVLRKIQEVQELDVTGIEGIAVIYERLLASLGAPLDRDLNSNPSDSEREEMIGALRNYLISTTAKDCSVMVAIRLLSDDSALPSLRDIPSSELRPVEIDFQARADFNQGDIRDALSIPQGGHTPGRLQEGTVPPPVTTAAERLIRPLVYISRVGVNRGDVLLGVLSYEVQVSLVDLDLKGHQKIPKHLDLDRRIVECGLRHFGQAESESPP